MGGCTFGGRALPPGLFGASSETGPFAWELLRSPSASPERSLPKQNYFFISKIENYRKSFIHADLPLFCTFPKFFPKSKQAVKSYLKFSPIFQNEFFQYRPILAVKFLTASRVCVAKVGAGIEKVSSTLQLPCPSILRGGVFFFLLLRHNYLMNILQNIFNDHYEEMVYILHPRQVVIDNVTKMINCGDPAFGGAMYSCPKCSNLKFVPFRCKSRFCPTCGIKYCQDRANSMAFQLIQCSHRHCVFTIDEDLRHFFLEDRSLLDCLFHAVRSVVLRMFFKLNMSRNFVPGFICVLHTFGRPLEWNPHIHCLVTEGGFSDDGFWRIVKHFDYTLLRMSFQTALLNEMEKQIGPSFKKIKAAIYKKDSNGFYVYAKPNLCDTKTVTKYISRYLGRPVIALNRIDSYDGKNVTFHYHRHEDNAFVKKCIPALDFISLLIQHIPEHHYKMIRYYGLYARHRNNDKKLRRAIPKNRQPIIRSFTKWRNNIALSFGYDPLCCPNCKIGMTLTDLYFNHKRIPLEEMYERTLAKFKCRSA